MKWRLQQEEGNVTVSLSCHFKRFMSKTSIVRHLIMGHFVIISPSSVTRIPHIICYQYDLSVPKHFLKAITFHL